MYRKCVCDCMYSHVNNTYSEIYTESPFHKVFNNKKLFESISIHTKGSNRGEQFVCWKIIFYLRSFERYDTKVFLYRKKNKAKKCSNFFVETYFLDLKHCFSFAIFFTKTIR